ncbi:UDP-N-acetylglucosamine 2-epimerase (hydrolyzing) [Candidatus Woesearchaeota archaeon]|jgi:GDP/UDP-N,N'-diacetylbacillosamine 2-epimerase (hydrolysing)|nr:UDP-N-acetylglucosamine 2-epimerase (hydrolyzing) [Candidatus Woesearchaeota archaeon]
MRKIAYLTGSRSEFGLMYSTLKAIQEHPKLELQLIVTGMHLSKEHNSIEVIKKSGLKISKIINPRLNIQKKGNPLLFSGKLMTELSKIYREIKPDIILIEADRYEQLINAYTSAMLNIPIAHTSGGDISGSIDNSIRHSITKFAHIHLPGTEDSKERIIKMGEEFWRIHLVGTPLFKKTMPKEELEKKLHIDLNKKTILVIQHPVSFQNEIAGKQMKITLEAIKELNIQTIILHPNGEPGSEGIIKEIQKNKDNSNFHLFKNLNPLTFISLLNNVSVMVGNSSAAIVEAPNFKLPSINIGIREQGREKAESTLNSEHDKKQIKQKINFALSKTFSNSIKNMKNPYNSNNVEANICEILSKIKINKKLINKKLTY